MGSVPGSGRTPGEGNGNPLQYACLGNPMDRGARQAKRLKFRGSQRVRHDSGIKQQQQILVVENVLEILWSSYFI